MHQLSLFKGCGEPIYISLPSSYEITSYDRKQLRLHNVEVVKVPDGLSLGQSVVYCLNTIGRFQENLFLLHGDTLFDELELQPDSYVVAKAEDNYTWAEVDEVSETVYAGFFSFSSPSLLIRSITECNNDFMAGVAVYGREHHLTQVLSNSCPDPM